VVVFFFSFFLVEVFFSSFYTSPFFSVITEKERGAPSPACLLHPNTHTQHIYIHIRF
jgi:hypothetical protein